MTAQKSFGSILGVTDAGLPIVTENYSCPHWAGAGRGLVSMQECWYCQFADFRRLLPQHSGSSLCRCPENRVDRATGLGARTLGMDIPAEKWKE